MPAKAKLKFWCSVAVALVSLIGGGSYLFSRWTLNNQNLEELKQKYAENKVLDEQNGKASRPVSESAAQKQPPTLSISFRAVGLDRVSPGADQEIAFNVLSEMKNSAYFDASSTRAIGEITPEAPLPEPAKKTSAEPPGTFSFKIVTKLKRPLTL